MGQARNSVKFQTILLLAGPILCGQPTFYADVLPILQKNCQSCHRPSEIAPFSLLTYEQARPWAKSIKAAVISRKMPPWFAEGGHFLNDRSLSSADIGTISAWATAGAPAGDPKRAPTPVAFTEGWRIHKPDAVFDMGADFKVPESGDVLYQYFVVPTGFKQDRWIKELEIRPGNRAAVHHIVLYTRPAGSIFMSQASPGRPFVPAFGAGHTLKASTDRNVAAVKGLDGESSEHIGSFFPGSNALQLAEGQAFLIRAGSDLIFEIHYTSSPKKLTDRSMVGLVFADKPTTRLINASWMNGNIRIPAGVPDHQEEAFATLMRDVELRAIQPHMHVRGVGFEVRAKFPSGEETTVLKLRRYDFNWQFAYELEKPMKLPAGTVLKIIGTFDNSANNRFNPDPTKDITWGEQTGTSEMLLSDFRFAIPIEQNPRDIVAPESVFVEGETFGVGSWQESARQFVQSLKHRLGH